MSKEDEGIVTFKFPGPQQESIFKLLADGDIWINPKYEVSEAAKIFWDHVRRYAQEEKEGRV